MRAVSSPSLSENILENYKSVKKSVTDENVQTNEVNQPPVSASVLQKFKKTFSNLKNKSSSQSTHPSATVNSTLDSGDATKYRFGPLIWRSSKERRKTKHHRRDKCNSGDSGIQVELENDDNISNDVTDSLETSPSFNVRVRRANSAKVTSSTLAASVKTRVLKKNEGLDRNYLTPMPGRSFSQPYGLNQITSSELFISLKRKECLKLKPYIYCRRR